MVTVKKRRLVNPQKPAPAKKITSPRAKRPKPVKANPLYILGFANPSKGQTVSKSKKKNPARRPKPNPAFFKASKPKKGYQKKHRHVRNPNVIEKPIEALKFGLLALLGLVATRQVPQLLLKEKNTGIMGYVSNLATAVAAGLGTGKFVSPAAGNAVMIGGGLYTINRVLTEQFSPVGKVLSLAGVGDHQASATLGGIRPVGLYPPAYDKNGRPIIGKEYIDAIGAALPAPPAAPSRLTGVSRVRSSRI